MNTVFLLAHIQFFFFLDYYLSRARTSAHVKYILLLKLTQRERDYRCVDTSSGSLLKRKRMHKIKEKRLIEYLI